MAECQLRIDYGIKAAKVGFEHAKLGQEKADELATQILLAAVTVGFALGFEPLLAAGLAKLGPKISESLDEFVEDLLGEGADIKELLENPAIESVGAASNIQSARSELPTPPQGILEGYLNINFQVLNEKLTETDTKFTRVTTRLNAKPDAEIERLDLEHLPANPGWIKP